MTEGKYNYFRYSFDADVSNAKFDKTVRTTSSIFDGDINAVEMVDYNQSEDDLYITFKQVADDLGSFAKFKLLFYKGDKIVYTEDGYFSVYAENLTGKDTTDVASISLYHKKIKINPNVVKSNFFVVFYIFIIFATQNDGFGNTLPRCYVVSPKIQIHIFLILSILKEIISSIKIYAKNSHTLFNSNENNIPVILSLVFVWLKEIYIIEGQLINYQRTRRMIY